MTNLEMAPLVCAEGNTIIPRVKRATAVKAWCFTIFGENGSSLREGVMEVLVIMKGRGIIGIEKCPTTGKTHLQGYVEFEEKKRPLETKALAYFKGHWEKAKGDRAENLKYCSKEKDYKMFGGMIIKRPILDWFKYEKASWWQKDVLEIINKDPEDVRNIHWYHDSIGKAGKNTLCRHILITRPYETMFVGGKAADVKHAISEFNKNQDNDLKIILFNYVRSVEDFVSYDAIESVKDAMFFSGKFESNTTLYNPPHVFIFANFKPDISKMSLDRWYINDVVSGDKWRGLDHV